MSVLENWSKCDTVRGRKSPGTPCRRQPARSCAAAVACWTASRSSASSWESSEMAAGAGGEAAGGGSCRAASAGGLALAGCDGLGEERDRCIAGLSSDSRPWARISARPLADGRHLALAPLPCPMSRRSSAAMTPSGSPLWPASRLSLRRLLLAAAAMRVPTLDRRLDVLLVSPEGTWEGEPGIDCHPAAPRGFCREGDLEPSSPRCAVPAALLDSDPWLAPLALRPAAWPPSMLSLSAVCPVPVSKRPSS
mmetsp:Transcript_11758/g.45872  ORF Transcript_11758/g.45872 Transcript_11758/m.45872 type:complete len:251 (-) Transcript_11758:1100-1852(-)